MPLFHGRGFVCDNEMLPVIDSTPWIQGKQHQYCRLIHSLGKPDFEYEATGVKCAYNFYKKNHGIVWPVMI